MHCATGILRNKKEEVYMKRIVLLFCTVMLFICSLCGCSASPEKNPSIPGGSTIPGGNTAKDPDDKNTEEAAFAALQKKICLLYTSDAADDL